jgi:acylphosphatase
MNQRVHAFFIGRVQGVGFRYTARSIAVSLGVCGWVKNRRDASVELVAEGQKPVLEQLLDELRHVFENSIQRVDIDWEPATGEFTEFSIAF